MGLDVVVQHVTTHSTKASRGGAVATARNAVPLPPSLYTSTHHVTHRPRPVTRAFDERARLF